MGGVDTLDKDDDELIFEEYIKRLGQVLEMRHRGKWVPETFDRYSESLVQVVAPPLPRYADPPYAGRTFPLSVPPY